MKTILALIMLALCASVQARIGETVAECLQRYGKPTTVDASGLTFGFNSNGLQIDITFAGGKCVAIQYSRWEKSIFGGFRQTALTSDEANVLLEANSGGQPWVGNGLFQSYDLKTENGDRYAGHDYPLFKIVTRQIKEDQEAKEKADQAARQAAEKAGVEKKLKGL